MRSTLVQHKAPLALSHSTKNLQPAFATIRHSSASTNTQATTTQASKSDNHKDSSGSQIEANSTQAQAEQKPKPTKSVLQQDEELRQKMSGLSGDGGESGIEYEDGKPVSMKRGVKDNMFRYI